MKHLSCSPLKWYVQKYVMFMFTSCIYRWYDLNFNLQWPIFFILFLLKLLVWYVLEIILSQDTNISIW